MDSRALKAILTAALLGLLMSPGSARAADYFWTGGNPPTALDVPGTDPSWSTNVTNRVVPAGGCVYFATDNTQNSFYSKSYTLTLTPNYALLSSNSATGYYTSASGTSGYTAATRTDVHDVSNNEMRVYATWSTQPAWEVVRIDNADTVNSKTVSMSGASTCATWEPFEPGELTMEAFFGPPEPAFVYPEVYMFPTESEVDITVAPTFTAPPATGNWTYSFGDVDPLGNAQLTGIKWESDGAGLGPDDVYQMAFSVVGSAKQGYYCYACEAGRQECKVFWIDTNLQPGEPIPALSSWGVAVLIIALLCAAGVILLRRKPAPQA